jgi:hypothetical protein
VVNTRQGTRQNIILGETRTPPIVTPGLSDTTSQRIVRALELLVASFREAHGLEILNWLQESLAPEGDL